jgi:hypothetical protein
MYRFILKTIGVGAFLFGSLTWAGQEEDSCLRLDTSYPAGIQSALGQCQKWSYSWNAPLLRNQLKGHPDSVTKLSLAIRTTNEACKVRVEAQACRYGVVELVKMLAPLRSARPQLNTPAVPPRDDLGQADDNSVPPPVPPREDLPGVHPNDNVPPVPPRDDVQGAQANDNNVPPPVPPRDEVQGRRPLPPGPLPPEVRPPARGLADELRNQQGRLRPPDLAPNGRPHVIPQRPQTMAEILRDRMGHLRSRTSSDLMPIDARYLEQLLVTESRTPAEIRRMMDEDFEMFVNSNAVEEYLQDLEHPQENE